MINADGGYLEHHGMCHLCFVSIKNKNIKNLETKTSVSEREISISGNKYFYS